MSSIASTTSAWKANAPPIAVRFWMHCGNGPRRRSQYREYYHLDRNQSDDGLSPEELALRGSGSVLIATLSGQICSAFDARNPEALKPFVEIIRKFQMPRRVRDVARELNLQIGDLVRSSGRLQRVLAAKDWLRLAPPVRSPGELPGIRPACSRCRL